MKRFINDCEDLEEIREMLQHDGYPEDIAELVWAAHKRGTLMWSSRHIVIVTGTREDNGEWFPGERWREA